ncbi:MAG: DUF3105 domain-containing protein [Nitrospira sp. CR1.3]|nr:DUF3105 domain-containing protein [Nitrospira sp. CR1.3]
MGMARRVFSISTRTMQRLSSGSFRATLHVSIVILVALTVSAPGCGLLANLPFLAGLVPGASKIDVVTKRRGCSEFSQTAVLTVVAPEQNGTYQWFFTDGTVQIGPTIVHTFENKGPQKVQLVFGAESQEIIVHIPVQGDPDGGPDPFGDTCLPSAGELHVQQGTAVNYRDLPPASGPHYSVNGVAPTAPGFYPDPVRPEVWVHNLEHGDIVILFDCQGDCDPVLLQSLQGFFNSTVSHKLVITRFPGLPSPIMAIAWQVQRSFDSFNAAELRAFHDRRVGQAPEGGE